MTESQMIIRKRMLIRVGDVLQFDPHIEGLAGPSSAFFKKYAGMSVEVLGFEADPNVLDMLGKGRKGQMNRLFVRFENGDTPEHSISDVHFLAE